MTTTTRATTTTTRETTGTTTGTRPELSPGSGRPEPGAAAAYLAELFAEHRRMVLGLCRLLLRDATEAEDAAQQVFVSAQRALLGGVVPREAPAWLAAIARNECRARIRARMREPLALPELPSDIPDPFASAIRTADLDAVWSALSALPRRQRNAFLLRELGGLSYAELGAALGVTRPAVESLLFRARQQLRDALTLVGAAFAPVARLLSGFGAGGATTAKVAAVAVGAGVGAVSVVELPQHHQDAARRQHARTPVPAVATPAPAPQISAPVVAEQSEQPSAVVPSVEREQAREAEHERLQAQPVEADRSDAPAVEKSGTDSSDGEGGGGGGGGDSPGSDNGSD